MLCPYVCPCFEPRVKDLCFCTYVRPISVGRARWKRKEQKMFVKNWEGKGKRKREREKKKEKERKRKVVENIH